MWGNHRKITNKIVSVILSDMIALLTKPKNKANQMCLPRRYYLVFIRLCERIFLFCREILLYYVCSAPENGVNCKNWLSDQSFVKKVGFKAVDTTPD